MMVDPGMTVETGLTVAVAPPPATPAGTGATGTVAPADGAIRGQLAPGVDMPFVWGAYGVSLVVLTVLWWRSRQLLRRAGEIGGRHSRAGRAEEERP